ncbi:extracelluar calcium binding protein [Rhodococcus ruber]|nr:extracelluar calcium binding protein [Rhodococcus ruber]
MAESMTPSEAKTIAERHLRSLGFVPTAGGGSSRMSIRAPGLVAKVTVRAAPVSRSELTSFYMDRDIGTAEARAYFAVNGYGPTAVDYARTHRIQLFEIDRAGRVTERNKVGLRAPDSVAPPSSPLQKKVESRRERPSDPRDQAIGAWERPEAEQVRRLLLAVARSVGAAIFARLSKLAEAVPERRTRKTSANQRANRGLLAVGVVIFIVVGGSVLASVNSSNSDRSVEPPHVSSTTPPRELSSAATTQQTTPEVTRTPSEIVSSSAVPTTTVFRPPPPEYMPSETATYVPAPPVNTPEDTPLPPAPESFAYYKNCDAARDAGVAPLLRGQAGYRPELDRDDDGVACEWN